MIVAAPGIGKTYLAAFFAQQMQAARVLFVSHRLEHLTQAEETFRAVYGGRTRTGLVGGGHTDTEAALVFCSIQSLREGSPLLERRFDLMVVDEFHHAAAPSYQRALQTVRPRFLLGLTATPERQDGQDVIRLCDYNIAYEVRLIEAIDRGWLLPFTYFGVADDTVEWDRISWRRRPWSWPCCWRTGLTSSCAPPGSGDLMGTDAPRSASALGFAMRASWPTPSPGRA